MKWTRLPVRSPCSVRATQLKGHFSLVHFSSLALYTLLLGACRKSSA